MMLAAARKLFTSSDTFHSRWTKDSIERGKRARGWPAGGSNLCTRQSNHRIGKPRDSRDRLFEPQMSEDEREARYAGWREAVERTLTGGVG